MKIIPLISCNFNEKQSKISQDKENTPKLLTKFEYNNCPAIFAKSFLVSFGARVDKGLQRFVETNAEVMPKTVLCYLNSLPDNSDKSPIDAHKEAFSLLELADSVEEIKDVFPNEPLFEGLIATKDSKARVGLIHDINVMRDVFDENSTPPIKTGEDLTVYLVKKVFLENKVLSEINEDLDKDLDEVFRNNDKKYVGYSTLDALGIKYPSTSYLTSLRYTQEGYSDKIGEKLSKSLSDFYKNMTPEQRTERNSKSLRNIEKWWSQLSENDKKALLLEKSSQIAFLKLFESSKKPAQKKFETTIVPKAERPETSSEAAEKAERIKTPLSEDPLFIEWATLNLEAYKASLSPEELADISEKRSFKMIDMWSSFSPEEKTDYISKMFIGSEKQKVAMIDAWNNAPEIRQDLSTFLKAKNLYRPEGLMYRTQEYSEAQSKVMKEFWEIYPQHAKKLGEEITASYQKVSKALENGTFEALRKEITDAQSASKQLVRSKKYDDGKSPVFKEFARQYMLNYSFLPKEFLQLYVKEVEQLDGSVLSDWTRTLKGETRNLQKDSMSMLESYKGNIFKEKAAMRQALSDVIFEATGSPEIFAMKYAQLTSIVETALRTKQRPLPLGTNSGQKETSITVYRDIDVSRLNRLYSEYSKPLSEKELNKLVESLEISKDNPLYPQVIDYLKQFGFLLKKLVNPSPSYGLNILSQIQNNFFEQIDDKNLGVLLIDSTYNVNIKNAVGMLLQNSPFLPENYAKRKANDILIKSTEDTNTSYEKLIDSDVADEYMAFVLRSYLLSATGDESVFDYTYDKCMTVVSNIYSGKKKIGDEIFVGGPKINYLPELKSIKEIYDMISVENKTEKTMFGLPVSIADNFPPENKEYIINLTSDFNKRYCNLLTYLELLGLSSGRKQSVILNTYKEFLEHCNEINEHFA